MRITRYGVREVIVSAAIFCLCVAACLFLFYQNDSIWFLLPIPLLTIVFGWVLWFFRDPSRVIPTTPGTILSPADGTITHLDVVDEPDYIVSKALRCSIFLSIFDPHLNRAPISGTIDFLQYRPGTFYDARSEDSLTKNENQDVGIIPSEAGGPSKVLVRQSSGAIARRIVCPVEKGQVLDRGERYGMIKFGSRTTLFMAHDTPIEWRVKIGDKVKAGETIIAVTGAAPDECTRQ